MTDKQTIVGRLQQGSRKALADLYKQYREEFINWSVSTYSISRDDARDDYQSAIIILYENFLSRKVESLNSSVKTYLFAIGKNKIRERLRAAGRTFPAADTGNDKITYQEELPDPKHDYLYDIFEACLDELGNPCKSVLVSFYYRNLTMAEIAAVYDYKNESTAKNSKYKCLQRLKRCVFAKTNTDGI